MSTDCKPMNICHVTQFCHIRGTAGTERYILELIRALRAEGVESSIAWLCGPPPVPEIKSDEIPIIPIVSPRARTDQPDADFVRRVEDLLLKNERPDVAHFHTFGLAEQQAAALFEQCGIPSVFTYHSPAWTCRRETMLVWGTSPCDGEVRTLRCSACKLQQRTNCTPLAGYAGAALSGLVGLPLQRLPTSSMRRRTAFVSETRRFRTALRRFLSGCQRCIACAEWSIPVLARNGAAANRITRLPQGVPASFLSAAAKASPPPSTTDQFVIGYVGRVTPVKGIHILIDPFL
ncbi:MAG: glycosyltransferase, partial [Verrucomicrobia bacterium]|nr:glycosyltransferase [Verrucomicrobiota bacterium]